MIANTATKSVEQYLGLPYTVEIVREEADGFVGWFARVVELPGCMTQAETFDELDTMVQDAMRAWIETAIAQGIAVPEPRLDGQFSGKFVIRVPRSLHKDLVEAAARDGVSLNAFVSVALARAVSVSA